jgi:tetratricopeptide (TPR) repeat protein
MTTSGSSDEKIVRRARTADEAGTPDETRADPPSIAGRVLGPYRLEAVIGAGGMGTVYRAVVEGRAPEAAAGTRVAVKVVHPHLLATPGFFKRFLREAEIGKRVVHENVVRTYDCDSLVVDGGRVDFLVMEHVEGQTLRGLAAELGRVPEELCRHVAREVAKGLAAIHAAGAVHRDLKPENLIITREHAVKVMDLGVARLAEASLRLSLSGAFVGSVRYAAPEQFRGGEIDGRADLHALGVVLYELATAQHPFEADDFRGTMRRVLDETPRRCAEVDPQLSPFFEELVHALLAKSPEERFASAAELASVLDEGESSAWWRGRAKAIRAATKRPLRRIRIPRETALHGREAELAKLRALYDRAAARDGRVVLVEGEAGIGKSRLVDEFVGVLLRDGEDLNFLFGSYPPGGAATASGAFSTAYREQFGEAGSADYLKQTPLLVRAFDALLRGDATPADAEPLTKDSLQTCFVHATRGLAADRTTIVLVDDLHFAPEEGRALFAALAMAVPGHRVLLVGTARRGLDEKWLAQIERAGAERMHLARLGAKDLVRLLGDAFRSERLAEELAGKIATKSDGNPFFVFEILRGLREGQFLTRRDDGTWATARAIAELEIPSSVLDLVNARVADLTEEERDLLDVACCWGYEFDPSLVAEVAGLSRVAALKRFGHVERRHRLVRSTGRRCVFDHHQVQEALYGALSEPLREEYHGSLAAALETRHAAGSTDPTALDGALCVDLAEHFLRGARGPRATRYLDAALAHLAKGCLNDAAVRLAERALAVPGLVEGKARCELLLRTEARLDILGRRDAQAAAVEAARALAEGLGDVGLRAKVRVAEASYLYAVTRLVEAESVTRDALELTRSAGDRQEETAVTGTAGLVLHGLGRYAEALAQFEECLALAREIGDRKAQATATGNLGIVFYSLGRHAEAQAQFERHFALARAIGDRHGETRATANLGMELETLGRYGEAQAHLERALALAQEIGERRGEAAITGNLANVFASLGRYAEARTRHERQLALSREVGYRRGEAIALVNLGADWQSLGDMPRAREALEASLALGRESGARAPDGYVLHGLGLVADEEGDPARALAWIEKALALRREIGQADGVADSLIALGDLRRRAGDADGASAALEESVSLSRAQGRGPQVALGMALLACLPGGDAKAAVAALAEAGGGGNSARTRLLLWRATGERVHLVEAKRLLDDLLAKNPDHREAMLANVRANREIADAAAAAGL